jgi:hypothetical protein
VFLLLESPCFQVSTTITVDEALSGLKTSFSFKVPDHKSVKVSIQQGGNISFTENTKRTMKSVQDVLTELYLTRILCLLISSVC